jgi:hypothetical protein
MRWSGLVAATRKEPAHGLLKGLAKGLTRCPSSAKSIDSHSVEGWRLPPMPRSVPTLDDLETETLDGDCSPRDLVWALEHLSFPRSGPSTGLVTVSLDRHAARFLRDCIKQRCGK